MTTKYPGGLIRKTPPTITPPSDGVGGSAPGMWTLEQASYYTKQGLWPQKGTSTELWAWGTGATSAYATTSSPVQVGDKTGWATSAVSGGQETFFAIKQNGTLWTWGTNAQGQLGQNDLVDRSSPTQVGSLTNWSKVSCFYITALAVKTDGTLWSWGSNGNGELGQNISDTILRSSPVQVGSLTDWSIVATGQQACAAIKTDGTLWTWGSNASGGLGQNIDAATNRSSPVQVGALTTWTGISAGYAFMLGMYGTTNNRLMSWGYGGFGKTGRNTTLDASSPTQVGALTTWASVSCGYDHSLTTRTDNTLWSFGRNNYGQLGAGLSLTTGDRSSPVQVAGTSWSIVRGAWDSSFAIRTTKTLFAFGRNTVGQLGLNDTAHRSSPVQVGSLTTWLDVSGGDNATLGLKTPT